METDNMNRKAVKTDSPAERMQKVLEAKGMKSPTFARNCGLRYQRIYDIVIGRIKNISNDIIYSICKTYPDVSRTYLLTGEGAPIKSADEYIINDEKLLSLYEKLEDKYAELDTLCKRAEQRLDFFNSREVKLMEMEKKLALKAEQFDTVLALLKTKV